VFGNGMARSLSANAAAPRTIFELFPRIEIIRRELDAMAAGKSRSGYVNCTISTRKGERIAYTLNIQGIKNEADDCIGALVIASEDPSIRDFRVRFGITERQIEILYLSVSGLSNREIAKRLGLSERTVEHHHFNIYNKLGVDNKIELYNIALKYRILSN
jgi:DNA-binding CsgD family transcriptional regulator